MMYFADSGYDMVMIEMEHEGLSFNNLRASLQFLLNRKRIADAGGLQADPTPVVRIPPNTRETNQWVIKQTLDTGVYGLILPHLDTVEGAMAAVQAARYPQVPGVPDFEPHGERGWWQRIAPRYWGLSASEYYDAADVWPLDPDGNLLLMGIVEEPTGRPEPARHPAPGQGYRRDLGRTRRHVRRHGTPGQRRPSRGSGDAASYPADLQRRRRTLRHWLHRG